MVSSHQANCSAMIPARTVKNNSYSPIPSSYLPRESLHTIFASSRYGPSSYSQYGDSPSSELDIEKSGHNMVASPSEERYTPSVLGWLPDSDLIKLYAFVVRKGEEPFLELLPKWTPTFQTPQKVYFDPPRSPQKGIYPCVFPSACRGNFGRPADLDRHYKHVHASHEEKESFVCDYSKCERSKFKDPFTRKDHYRDHLRDYHKEDIGCAKGATSMDRQTAETAQNAWMGERRIDDNWWRCSKCLTRCCIDKGEWKCWHCGLPCEPDRLAHRSSMPEGRRDWTSDMHANRTVSRRLKKPALFERRKILAFGTMTGSAVLSPILYATTNFTSGCMAGFAFQMLSRGMNLGNSSETMQKISMALGDIIPEFLGETNLQNWQLLVIFVLAMGLFTGTTFAWAINKRQQTASKLMAMALALVGMSFWTFMHVTAEELFLVFLPMCTSVGILCSCIIDRGRVVVHRSTFEDEKRGINYAV